MAARSARPIMILATHISAAEADSQRDRLSSLLESNQELSPSDLACLQNDLRANEAAEAALRKHEEKLFRELHDTRRHRQELKALIETQKHILRTAAVRQLPNEILLDIFERVLEMYKSDPYTDPRETHDGILAMSRVCRRWRNFAVGRHELWSDIDVANWSMVADEDMARLRTVLRHSKDHPLRIVYSEDSDDTDHNLWYLLLTHASHWRSLRADIRTCGFVTWRINALKKQLPVLERLDLRILKDGAKWERTPCTLDLFASAPHLRSVTLRGFRDPSPAKLPWENVTSLCFGSLRLDSDLQLDVIQKAVSLRRLKCIQFLHDVPEDNISIPTLRQWTGWSEQLSIFTLPALQSLKMKLDTALDVRANTVRSLIVFSDFVFRSRCVLTSLHIHNIEPGAEMEAVLGTLSQLRRLHIGYRCTHAGLLQYLFGALIPPAHGATLLPSLETLVLYDAVGHKRIAMCTSRALLEMVQSRWDSGSDDRVAKLRRIAVRLNRPWHKDEYRLTTGDVELIDRWKGEGLDIAVMLPGASQESDGLMGSDESDDDY